MNKKHLHWVTIIWSLIIFSSAIWNCLMITTSNRKLVLNKSKAFFDEIVVTRSWNAQHGGVYVPVTATTPPNQYLNDKSRDIVTTDSMQLTMLNPAYMTRQIADIHKTNFDVQFHITSLNPVRPENKADNWETNALVLFNEGISETFELVKDKPGFQYRYMAPLITEQSCLDCHSHQGYKVGDIIGGISVSYPATLYLSIVKGQIFSIVLFHLIILIMGIAGLIYFHRLLNKNYTIIKNKNIELEHLNTTKNRLFSIIAHDLTNPFNSILGFAELLMTEYENLGEHQRKNFIRLIHKSSQNTYELLKMLLLWAKTQMDNVEIIKTECNLEALIIEAVQAHLVNADKKNINFTLDIPDNITAWADRFAIKTVIANLFGNAIKFTPEGGRIEISARQMNNDVEIKVSDNGVGISPHIIPKLFSMEKNFSTYGTNKEKGSGLGLLICKEFVVKQGGKIWVESELGEGSDFYFTISNKPA